MDSLKRITGRSRSLALVAAAVAVLGMAGLSFARPQVLIGDFEDATLDGFGSDGGPGSPVLSQGTVGVTHGSHSLAAVNPQGGFWGPATGNLITLHRNDLMNASSLQFDLTLNNADLNGGTPGFSGFAQSNELAITLFSPAGGSNINLFIQHGAFGALTDSLGQGGGWNGVDGTRTLTWNLAAFTATDPNDSTTKTVAQFLAQYPDIVDAKIAFVEQAGGGAGPATFYFDNVILNTVPEPASLGLIGLIVPALVARRRRTRA